MNPFTTHGAISWQELLVADPYKARSFYESVLGWQFQEWPMPPDGIYHTLRVGDLNAGGIMKRPSEDIPPCWTFYVTVDDIRALVEGNDLQMAVPVEDSPAGPFCGFFDRYGAYLAAIQYTDIAGVGGLQDFRATFRTHGLFSWFELLTSDPEGAAEYYSKLFGWTVTGREFPGGIYRTVGVGDAEFGGIAQSPDSGIPSHWSGYVTVEDIEKTLEAAQLHGAKVQVPVMEIPDVGRMAQVEDPEGASVKFLEYLPMDG